MPEFQQDSRFAEFYHIDLSRKNDHQRSGGQLKEGQSLFFDSNGNTFLFVDQLRLVNNNTNVKATIKNHVKNNLNWASLTSENFNEKNKNTNQSNELTQFVYKSTDNPHHSLIILEYICITWFSIEFTIRFVLKFCDKI